jgi:DNA-binding GntR family transcriptional regulator
VTLDSELLAPIGSKSRPELIAERLRAAVATGALAPAQQLGEVELARAFGVSRGPLREAMARLVAEGLLVNIPHRGIFVAELTDEDVADIYAVRTAIETAAAKLIVTREADRAVRRLRDACAQMKNAVMSGDSAAMSDADHLFHTILVEESGSRRLLRSAQTLLVETRMCLGRLEGKYVWPMAAAEEHEGIVEALESADLVAIERVVGEHMLRATRLLTGEGPDERVSG